YGADLDCRAQARVRHAGSRSGRPTGGNCRAGPVRLVVSPDLSAGLANGTGPCERRLDPADYLAGVGPQLPPREVNHVETGVAQVNIASELLTGTIGIAVFERRVGLRDRRILTPQEVDPSDGTVVAAHPDLEFRSR